MLSNTCQDKLLMPSKAHEAEHLMATNKDTAEGASLLDVEFSFTIADPDVDNCPLLGCSTGFATLTGYSLEEVVGRNCRFLLDFVPAELVDQDVRTCCRDFCKAVAMGEEYTMPVHVRQPWMLVGDNGKPSDKIIVVQLNSRKDGTLFHNLICMKKWSPGGSLSEGKTYIVGLQAELPNGPDELKKLAGHRDKLDADLSKAISILSRLFFKAPAVPNCWLSSAFSSEELQPWVEGRFSLVAQLADARKNKGTVQLMRDLKSDQLYAVKQMPNAWIQQSHEDFTRVHPREIEMPWVDIGCTRYLNSVNYKYSHHLQGVYRNDESTFVVLTCDSGDSMFDEYQESVPPGPARESALAPFVVELFSALEHLHDIHIAHRGISLESVVLKIGKDGKPTLKLVDYSMASTMRHFKNSASGKAAYQAPELHIRDEKCDAFLQDVFAAGVVVFALLLREYPWLSTQPGGDRTFRYFQSNGLLSLLQKNHWGQDKIPLATCMSSSLIHLLEGLLSFEPSLRLTLARKQLTDRRSVWDEHWANNMSGSGKAASTLSSP